MSSLVFIYTTFSSSGEAKKISEWLLNDKLVVCVNIFPEVNSLYLWEGKINNSCEVVTVMKTMDDKVDRIIDKIESMHSYDKPVIAVVPIGRANKSFTNWANNVIGVRDI
ncbi:MAG: divalent-cation tolerance protein CutA [Wolbachia sp.]|nr:divalent-cation tolerance protein CutA [Wolbachia sp.]MDD9335906.1 divalent-cation tolerance protein CutA [Wolbachia sp.]